MDKDSVSAVGTTANDGPLEAIRSLTEVNRIAADRGIEEELVRLRHEAFEELELRAPEPWPPITAAPVQDGALRELPGNDLTPSSLRAGLSSQGCVLIRELIPPARAEELAAGIDRALAAFDAGTEGAPASETSPWYMPFTPRSGTYRVGGRRGWMRASGGMWTADSPRMLFEVLELFEEIGIRELLTAHFGERPVLSANKCNLRRVPVTTSTNWHQDGAFLGPDIRTINVWLTLSRCGTDAPGLDVVPKRLDQILETGTGGAIFDWSVSPAVVAGAGTSVRPELGPGDALLFDQFFVHRTGVDPGMTQERHAIETWFFAPSTYPEGQIPLVY